MCSVTENQPPTISSRSPAVPRESTTPCSALEGGRRPCCPRSRNWPWRATPARRSPTNSACRNEPSITGCKRPAGNGSPRRPRARQSCSPPTWRGSTHEELRDVAEGLKCVVEADGGSVPAEVVDQDVEHMNEDQLRGYRTRLFAAIEAVSELAAFQAIDTAEDPQPGRNSSKFGQKSPVGGSEDSQPGRNSSKFGQESPMGGSEDSQPGRNSSKFGQKSPVGSVGKPDIANTPTTHAA